MHRLTTTAPAITAAYTDADKVALNVGFYYMANAGGRLVGSLLSGLSYQMAGIAGCLLLAAALVASSFLIAPLLPSTHEGSPRSKLSHSHPRLSGADG